MRAKVAVIKEKRKEQKLVKAHCVDLAGTKPRVESPYLLFEEIRGGSTTHRQTNRTGLIHRTETAQFSQGNIKKLF